MPPARVPKHPVVKDRSERAETRRGAILDAALHVVAEHGLSATTMERVALKAGVSPGTVTFHFARKEALLLAALDHVAAGFETARREALAAAGDDPAQALDALVDVSFDPTVSAPQHIAVWTAFWGEAKARRIYRERVGAADAAYYGDLKRLVRAVLARRPGASAGAREADALALGFAGVIDGLWQEALVAGRRFDRAAARALARAYLTAVFPHEALWTPHSRGEPS
ncbi:MAG: TetR family transcriptional regulator C-terminal domain-containing protein [Alphaproteobacteria bacterium]|nr:TetR family transcriptional regulator C-terminal domain-containing protein [Alphaproteobacteria bacterium]